MLARPYVLTFARSRREGPLRLPAFEHKLQELQAAASEAWGEGGRPVRVMLPKASQSIGGWISESESAHLAVLGGEALPFCDRTVLGTVLGLRSCQADWDSSQLCKTDGGGVVAALFEALGSAYLGALPVTFNCGRLTQALTGQSLFAPSFGGTGRSCSAAA